MKRLINTDVLTERKVDNLNISMADGNISEFNIPPLIKASISITDKMLDSGINKIVVVFPERKQSTYLFGIFKVIDDILEDRVVKLYDPSTFIKGQKLSFNDCIVEFDGLDDEKGKHYIWINTMDKNGIKCRIGVPRQVAPFFHPTDTLKPISKHQKYAETLKIIEKQRKESNTGERLVEVLKDYKTHINSSVGIITSVTPLLGILENTSVSKVPIKDAVLIGQGDLEGNVRNIGKGKLSGNPTIIIAPDLYAMSAAMSTNANIKLIIIDVKSVSDLEKQLDILDKFLQHKIPVICMVDSINSFDLAALTDRNFAIWRWDAETICPEIISSKNSIIDKKLRNSSAHQISYSEVSSINLSKCYSTLQKYSKFIENENVNIIKIHKSMFNLLFKVMRSVSPISVNEKIYISGMLYESRNLLNEVKWQISEEKYSDYNMIINLFEEIQAEFENLEKVIPLKNILDTNENKTVCVIVDKEWDRVETTNFLKIYTDSKRWRVPVSVLSHAEFITKADVFYDLIVVSGWYGESKMKKVLYSYTSPSYHVILYDFEGKWKNAHTRKWNQAKNEDNKEQDLGKLIYGKANVVTPTEIMNEESPSNDTLIVPDELNEIELIIKRNEYRHYEADREKLPSDMIIKAIPVNFSGGCFSFFKPSHKLICVSDVLEEAAEAVRMVFPEDLKENDLIVIREAEKDLIRDIADKILENSNEKDARKIAGLWRSALLSQKMTFISLIRNLRKVGCKKIPQTVHGWMDNDDIIAPQDEFDIVAIASATQYPELMNKLEDVINSAALVRSAHIMAGKKLSEQLKKQIPLKLAEIGSDRLSTIWKPLDIHLDEIGPVKLLKVSAVGNSVEVGILHINKILFE